MNFALKYYLLVCAALVVVWCGALGMPFAQDDFVFLLPFETGGDGMAALLDWRQGYFRPVSQALFFRLLTLAGKPSPVICHIIVFVLYLGVVGIYCDLVRRLSNSTVTASLAAFIFGSRSAHFLAVAWLSAAQEIIMAGFAMGALWVIVYSSMNSTKEDKPEAGAIITVALITAAALLSKETALILPLLVFALVRFLKKRDEGASNGGKTFVLVSLGVTIAWAVFRMTVGSAATHGVNLASNVRGFFINVVAYPLLFFDVNREVLRCVRLGEMPPLSIPLVVWGISLCAVLLFVLWVVLLFRPIRREGADKNLYFVFFAVMWGFIALLPALLNTRQFYGYYALLANGGWAFVVGILITQAIDSKKVERQFVVVFLMLIFALSVSSVWLQACLPRGNYQRAIRITEALKEVRAEYPNVQRGSAVVLEGLSVDSGKDARLWRALGWGAAIPFIYSDPSMKTFSAFYPLPEDGVNRNSVFILPIDKLSIALYSAE